MAGYVPTAFPKLADNVAIVNQQVRATITFNEAAADVSLSFHKPIRNETELSGKVNYPPPRFLASKTKVTPDVGG
ncbi:hypothetical protein ES703_57682 [subsurface metagenome]